MCLYALYRPIYIQTISFFATKAKKSTPFRRNYYLIITVLFHFYI